MKPRTIVVVHDATDDSRFEVLRCNMIEPGESIAAGLSLEDANTVCATYARAETLRALPLSKEAAEKGPLSKGQIFAMPTYMEPISSMPIFAARI